MSKRSSFYILVISFVFASCSAKNEREVLSRCIPENRFLLKLVGAKYFYDGFDNNLTLNDCRMGWWVNDSILIEKNFKLDKHGSVCHSTIAGIVYYHFHYSKPMHMAFFLKKNSLYPVSQSVSYDTIFKKVFDKKRGYMVKSDSVSKILSDTTFVFYNDYNHKFYLSYHPNRKNLNWIICSEIDKVDILKYTSD